MDEARYGYDLDVSKLYIASDGSAEIVKRIFKEYMEGHSFARIARELSRVKSQLLLLEKVIKIRISTGKALPLDKY